MSGGTGSDKTATIKMLHDRLLVEVDKEAGERRSTGGIVIPATAAMGARRLAWSRVIAVGPHARAVEVGDEQGHGPHRGVGGQILTHVNLQLSGAGGHSHGHRPVRRCSSSA